MDAAVEDLKPSSSLRSCPIRWISFTFVRLLDFQFEKQGHHILLFRPTLFKIPFFIFFFYCLANIMSCNKLDELKSHGNRKGRSASLLHLLLSLLICFGVFFDNEE